MKCMLHSLPREGTWCTFLILGFILRCSEDLSQAVFTVICFDQELLSENIEVSRVVSVSLLYLWNHSLTFYSFSVSYEGQAGTFGCYGIFAQNISLLLYPLFTVSDLLHVIYCGTKHMILEFLPS